MHKKVSMEFSPLKLLLNLNPHIPRPVLEHVRCNPDVAPHLTSGGYEDKVDVITPIIILFRGCG